MFTISGRVGRTLAAVPIATVLLAAPAQAYMQATYYDAVRITASGSALNAHDTKCDGMAAQANWQRTGSTTVYEKDYNGGCGTTLTFTTAGTVTQIRACLVVAGGPDPCSAWTSKQY